MKSWISILLFGAFLSACFHQSKEEGFILHTVYLNLIDELTPEEETQLLNDIHKLSTIPGVRDLEVGFYKDLGDQRAMDEFEIVLQMKFKDQADYMNFQNHPIHLQLKETGKSKLASPPRTHDAILK